jgi:Holliday junction resolvase
MTKKLKLTAPKPNEGAIRGQIRDYLRYKGWFVFHVYQALGSYPGISDLIAVKAGQVFFIEVKRPGNKQQACQKQFQEDLERAGGKYILADDVEVLIERGF